MQDTIEALVLGLVHLTSVGRGHAGSIRQRRAASHKRLCRPKESGALGVRGPQSSFVIQAWGGPKLPGQVTVTMGIPARVAPLLLKAHDTTPGLALGKMGTYRVFSCSVGAFVDASHCSFCGTERCLPDHRGLRPLSRTSTSQS